MGEKTVMIATLVILGVILVAGGGAVYYLNFMVKSDKQAEIQQTEGQIRISQKKAKMVAKDPKRGNKSLMEIAVEQRKTDIEGKRGKVPAYRTQAKKPGDPTYDREYDYMLNQLEGMRRRAGIIITSFRYKKPRRKRGGTRVPATIDKREFELICAGRFYGLLRFLNLIETDSRQINLDSFTIAGGIVLKLKLHSYAHKGKAKRTSPARRRAPIRKGKAKTPPKRKGEDKSKKGKEKAVEIKTTDFP